MEKVFKVREGVQGNACQVGRGTRTGGGESLKFYPPKGEAETLTQGEQLKAN